jgi:hypothetical protein
MSVWAAWMLQGRSRCILIVATTGLLGLFPHLWPFAVFSCAAVTLVALRNRLTEIAAILIPAFGLCAVFLWATVRSPEIALQPLLFWILAALAAIVLRRSSNLALAMLVPMFTGLLAVGFVYATIDQPAEYWKKVIIQGWELLGQDPDMPGFMELAAQRAQWMTGMVGVSATVGMSVCLFLGRWWQASLYNPQGFGREFRNLRFGRAISVLIAGLYVLFLWQGSELLLSVLCVLASVYAFQGLALAHAFARAKALNVLAITFFYVILVFSVYAKLLLPVVGIVDAWVDARRRWLDGASVV